MIETSPAVITGIDVSHYQGNVDWKKVFQSQTQFAFLKATEGATYVDPTYERNWAEARSAGVLCGAYHFFRPSKSPEAQATNFLNTSVPAVDAALPPVLDLEVPADWASIPREQRISLILRWLDLVESVWKMPPIVYLSPSFIGPQGVLSDASQLSRHPLWIAHYTDSSRPTVPPPWQTWTFWQHTQTGTMPGIAGKVDLDRFHGSAEDLYRLTQFQNRVGSL